MFVLPRVVVQINSDSEHHLWLEEVFLGDATVQYVESTDEITSLDLKKIHETWLSCWSTASKQAFERLPMGGEAFFANKYEMAAARYNNMV